ncbi:MAG: hypothetical protein COA94_04805 [Rickettsiales bacterium]|nr:MAG: hypothetical protein COA94_04805 [Rickettsiales bacterium]
MANIKDVILGVAPKAVIEQRDTINKEQKSGLAALLQELQGDAPQVSVPVTEGQQTLIDQSVGGNAVAQGEIDSSTEALKRLFDPAGDFDDQVQNPLIRDFNENILPQISRGFGNDFFSSERQRGDERATEDLLQTLVSEKSRFLRDDRATQLGAGNSLTANASNRGTILQQFLQSAGIGRDIEEGGNLKDEGVRQELLKLLLGASTNPTKETIGIAQGGQKGVLGDIIKSVGSAFSKKSDRRLKKNITRIGTFNCGAPKYMFQYVWGDWSIGCMAQEIGDYVSGAVLMDDDGYFSVDYSKFS